MALDHLRDFMNRPGVWPSAARAAALLLVVRVGAGVIDSRHPHAPALYALFLGVLCLVWGRLITRWPAERALDQESGRRPSWTFPIMAGVVVCASFVAYMLWLRHLSIAPGPRWRESPVSEFVADWVGAPLLEEYVFRGFLHREFVQLFRTPAVQVWANATWFALGHSPPSIPVALVVGAVNTAMVIRGHSLWPAIGIHAAVNLTLDVVITLY